MNLQEMFFETESPFSFEPTVEKLTNVINEFGWRMPAVHDLQQTMLNFGKEVLPVKVFEICHPRHSSKILELNDERVVSAMMPCRISVYEKNDGKTYVSRINSGLLAGNIGGIISEVMTDATNDVEMIVEKALSK
jgi:uncharacterized protein (DUF302 family)